MTLYFIMCRHVWKSWSCEVSSENLWIDYHSSIFYFKVYKERFLSRSWFLVTVAHSDENDKCYLAIIITKGSIIGLFRRQDLQYITYPWLIFTGTSLGYAGEKCVLWGERTNTSWGERNGRLTEQWTNVARHTDEWTSCELYSLYREHGLINYQPIHWAAHTHSHHIELHTHTHTHTHKHTHTHTQTHTHTHTHTHI